MTTYKYVGYMTDNKEVTLTITARDGDEARRKGRELAEADGRRVVLQSVKVLADAPKQP